MFTGSNYICRGSGLLGKLGQHTQETLTLASSNGLGKLVYIFGILSFQVVVGWAVSVGVQAWQVIQFSRDLQLCEPQKQSSFSASGSKL